MKNQLLRSVRPLLLWSLLIMLWAALSACSGVVKGKVYFDENGNSSMDAGEVGASQVKVSILKDGKVVKEGYTLPDGSFAFKKEKGVYYLKVDLTGLDYDEARARSTAAAKGLKSTTTGDTGTDSDADDKTDDDADKDESDDSEETAAASEPEIPEGYKGYVSGSGHKIVSNNNYSKLTDIFIPIGFDRASALAKLPSQSDETCYTGDTCEVKLFGFTGCRMELEVPSDAVIESSSGWQQDSALNMAVYPAEGEAELAAQTKASDSGKLSPKVKAFVMPMRISDDAEEREFKLEPVIYCAGEDSLQAKAKTLKIKRQILPEVTLSYGGYQISGTTGEVRIEVSNKGKSKLSGEVIVSFVDLTSPATGKLPTITDSGSCDNLGNGARCEVADLKAGATASPFKLEVLLPDTTSGAAKIKIDAVFDSEYLDKELSAEAPITLTIPVP